MFSPHGLIVDDDAAVLALATAVLSGEGYHVRSAGSVLEGFARAVTSDDQLDFLVTDYDLGSSTGVKLASAVRSLYPGVRVLLMSGIRRDLVEGDVRVDAFLPKPFTATALKLAVASLLEPAVAA
jgi:DNA-binding NtrC family response regulator